MRKILALYFFLLAYGILHAQNTPLFFQRITSDNGLSNNNINCILQDSRGFMWIGTNDGLNRFDGTRVTVFRYQSNNTSSIGGNIISHIIEDKSGLLWIATTDGGISRYDCHSAPDKQFVNYKFEGSGKKSIPGNIINSLLLDPNGMLWLGTSGRGLVRFNTQSGEFDQLPANTGSTVLDMELAPDGRIWAGLQGHGIIKVDPVSMKFERPHDYNDPYKKLPHVVVSALYKDSWDDMWVGSWDKVLYRYRKSSSPTETIGGAIASAFSGEDALSFAEDAQGRLWIGGKFNGLYILNRRDSSTKHFVHNPAQEGTLSDNRINCIYRDRDGNMWLGTPRGISLYRPLLQQFTQTFLPASENGTVQHIYDFTEDIQRNLFIATDKGIYIQKKGETGFKYRPVWYNGANLQVTRFYWNNGQLVIGTNRSLFLLDLLTFACRKLPNTEKDIVMNSIIESRVVSIAADSVNHHPVMWVVPYGHYLAYYDFNTQQWVSRQDSSRAIVRSMRLSDNLIRKIVVDKKGTRWIATAKEGLGRMLARDSAFTYYSATNNSKAGLSATDVYDILPDNDGGIWVSTHGRGLFYGSGNPISFRHVEGSPNLCEGMQLDESRQLWCISGNNLYKYRIAEKKFYSWQVPDIEKGDGIGGYLYLDKSGYLYAAGSNYYFKFLPSSLTKNSRSPVIYITDFRVNANSRNDLLLENNNRFAFKNNTLTFEFAAPKTPDEEQVGFEYRMSGLNEEWIPANGNIQTFPNLQPGNYTFQVRVSGMDTPSKIASYSFIIIPPFYRTWWFFAIGILLLAALGYAVYRYRINEILKQQAMRNKIAQDLHDSVGSTLSSISVYSQVAKIYKQQDKQIELQDTLEKISATSGEMISEMNDIVWAINPRNDNMDIILQRMESYAKPLLQAKGITFDFDFDPAILSINLAMEQRKNCYLIFKEAVNNALKYSGCKHMDVMVSTTGKQFELEVSDDGEGFDSAEMEKKMAKSLSGNGLNNMRRRAKDMKGECQVISSPGHGTTIRLRFPIT